MTDEHAIAAGVGPDGKIWTKHFGMAPYYYIFDRRGNLLEKRENPHSTGKHHDDPTLIVEMLPECDTFLARRMGARSRKKLMEEMGVTPVLVGETDPETAVRDYLKGVK